MAGGGGHVWLNPEGKKNADSCGKVQFFMICEKQSSVTILLSHLILGVLLMLTVAVDANIPCISDSSFLRYSTIRYQV